MSSFKVICTLTRAWLFSYLWGYGGQKQQVSFHPTEPPWYHQDGIPVEKFLRHKMLAKVVKRPNSLDSNCNKIKNKDLFINIRTRTEVKLLLFLYKSVQTGPNIKYNFSKKEHNTGIFIDDFDKEIIIVIIVSCTLIIIFISTTTASSQLFLTKVSQSSWEFWNCSAKSAHM